MGMTEKVQLQDCGEIEAVGATARSHGVSQHIDVDFEIRAERGDEVRNPSQREVYDEVDIVSRWKSFHLGEEAQPDLSPVESLSEASAHFERGRIGHFASDGGDCHLPGRNGEVTADLEPLCGAEASEEFAIARVGSGRGILHVRKSITGRVRRTTAKGWGRLTVVPRDGIELPTRGFSGPGAARCKRLG